MSYGSNILGGFLGTLWRSETYNDGSAAVNIGVVTRITPVLDPHNLNVRGTGERGLYDILLGTRDPRITIDFQIADKTFLTSYQSGSTAIKFLHLKMASGGGALDGLTFVGAKVERITVTGKSGEMITCTAEFWAGGNTTYPSGLIRWNGSVPSQAWGVRSTTPFRWLNSTVTVALALQSQWWEWSYEVRNNLQRLANVSTGGTRDLKNKARDLTGQIIMDLEDFTEWGALANLTESAGNAHFPITITLDSTPILDATYCRWTRLEAPFAAEDLIAKRFPFTATDLTALVP